MPLLRTRALEQANVTGRVICACVLPDVLGGRGEPAASTRQHAVVGGAEQEQLLDLAASPFETVVMHVAAAACTGPEPTSTRGGTLEEIPCDVLEDMLDQHAHGQCIR